MTSKMDRRTFLQGTSVAALSSMLPGGAHAQMPVPLSAPSRKISPAATPATFTAATFNGGRSQANLAPLQIGGDYPFLNCLKNAQSWTYIDDSGPAEPSTLDSDGYPMSISHGGVYTVFFVPSQAARPGNYVITWNGNGTIWCGMNSTPVSGSMTSTNGSGRYVFSTTETRFGVGISAIGNPRITNLQV